ncbi:twin-arginine translocase subunit TatB [Sphingomonas sp. CGMCC 1.13654]|uniref:Twin-arginine translocase subunit TatB n=1 Tax=Sphingomonas chungangi TaxID=2683589 RepID=A0A838L1Q9_9SPHN|nr:Sec-independent protein translocase protein TatB [Sphingomonas chungangi]MBA2933433.1 twin-arginine translocase subunit TatB [Sphingomonas chungangi]MVW54766.1 twin-arginine translocase subunit TatB [Sphingomonas chungangi]
MFDIAPSELMLVALVAIVFIGPKDLPKAMRFVGQWVGKGRTMARHFRSAMDEMVREAEMAEMEAKWKAENERIMREHADLMASVTAPHEALPAPPVAAGTAEAEMPKPAAAEEPMLPLEPAAPVRQPPEA